MGGMGGRGPAQCLAQGWLPNGGCYYDQTNTIILQCHPQSCLLKKKRQIINILLVLELNPLHAAVTQVYFFPFCSSGNWTLERQSDIPGFSRLFVVRLTWGETCAASVTGQAPRAQLPL